jgi:hypothetical protein
MQKLLSASIFLILFYSCAQFSSDGAEAGNAMYPDSMKQNIMILASDAYMGRNRSSVKQNRSISQEIAALGQARQ